ncbi:AraC family transcriptional regulator [Paenibacillus sp. PL2-23]|uniref:AraC family transcriptional regulator n=1 Tax=Paenibacillus sp. PL2-23 TaxID=2100729 RepID=UPI0030F9DA44
MSSVTRRRFVLTPAYENTLPLYIESIGDNTHEALVDRQAGYPFFHWIQTLSGEGAVRFQGGETKLPVRQGIFLHPNVPHHYEPLTERWETLYITFGGTAAQAVVASLGLESGVYHWEDESPLSTLPADMLRRVEDESDMFGLGGSTDVYRFLIHLQKYGHTEPDGSVAGNARKLQPLIRWLETNYDDASIGIERMASRLHVSMRTLNSLFRETFGLTPYAYLLHIRIRQAKTMLLNDPRLTVKAVAAATGFRDVSHFTATFRRAVGMPPDRFRKLH